MTPYGIDPGEREAERLRIIMEAFLAADPFMKLQQAIPAIFETEKRTAELERQQVLDARPREFELPDTSPETIARWIELTPRVQALIPTTKIQAIKEVRISCTYRGIPVGLKEAKDGVEYWEGKRTLAPRPTGAGRFAPGTIALWISLTDQADIQDLMRDGKKIYAIKEVRTRYGAGLKEAKDGVEQWEKIYA